MPVLCFIADTVGEFLGASIGRTLGKMGAAGNGDLRLQPLRTEFANSIGVCRTVGMADSARRIGGFRDVVLR